MDTFLLNWYNFDTSALPLSGPGKCLKMNLLWALFCMLWRCPITVDLPPAQCISIPPGGFSFFSPKKPSCTSRLSAEVWIPFHETFQTWLKETLHQLSLAATPITCPNNSERADQSPAQHSLLYSTAQSNQLVHLSLFGLSSDVRHKFKGTHNSISVLEAAFYLKRMGKNSFGESFGLEPTLPKNALHKSPFKSTPLLNTFMPSIWMRGSRF